MTKNDLVRLSDEELVSLYRNGRKEAADILVEKYKNLVRMKARTYFLIGADNDDIIQEGMIGLYKAIRDFNPDKEVVFMSFASLCIGRQIRTAITINNRKKNIPLNESVSLDAPVSEDDNDNSISLGDILMSDNSNNPEAMFIDKEQTHLTEQKISDNLSTMEKKVLELYMEGMSYAEIALHLNRPEKSVDNAIQRIRNKINLLLDKK